jgi:DNA-binding HxlR family transcriptional regulator
MAAFNKIIHERVRLLIMTYLANADEEAASFNDIQQALKLSSGNLSVQLKNLKQAEYVDIQKSFKENKPHTTVTMTDTGAQALAQYLEDMEQMIKAYKQSARSSE